MSDIARRMATYIYLGGCYSCHSLTACCCARYWCGTCCRYTYSQHYHPLPYYWHAHAHAEVRPHGKKKHRPYVDITPALPHRGC